jgi:DnaK suppressor protein
VAKITGKRPSPNGKPSKTAGSSRAIQKKPPLAVKVARSAKKVASKAVARPAAKSIAKPPPPPRFTEKSKTFRQAQDRPVRPAQSRLDRSDKGKSNVPAKAANGLSRGGAAVVALPASAAVRVGPSSNDPKLRKPHSIFTSREIEHFRDLLLAKRRELIGDMSAMEREALRTSGASNLSNLPIHMADMGTDNYEQEFTLGLVQKDRDLLKEINLALAKIQNGSYGLCEGTGQPILKERLEFQPWARYSVEHQRKMERHGR